MAKRTCTLDGCDRPHYARGYCKAHEARVRKTGSPGSLQIWNKAVLRKRAPQVSSTSKGKGKRRDYRLIIEMFTDRQYASIAKRMPDGAKGECWKWAGATTPAGYGQIRLSGVNLYTHRVRFMLDHPEVEPHQELDHLCYNRACYNPGHLRLADRSGNSQNLSLPKWNSTTGVRGVSPMNESSRYYVDIRAHGRRLYIGTFPDVSTAERAAITARLTHQVRSSSDLLRAKEIGLEVPEQCHCNLPEEETA